MKKNLTKLLIISIICWIISIILFFGVAKNNILQFSFANHVANDVEKVEVDNIAARWYLLIFGGMSAVADITIVFAKFMTVILIPSGMALAIMISQLIARLVHIGKNKTWKNTTSKFFTYISLFLQFLLCLILIIILLSNIILNKTLMILALIIDIISIILFIKEIKKIRVEISEEKNTSKGFSITSMVLGIISLASLYILYISLPCSILAIIFSIVGMKKGGKGMAIAGGVTGIVAICFYVLIFALTVIGVSALSI